MTPRESAEECVAADAGLCDLTEGTHRRLVERIEAAIIASSVCTDIHVSETDVILTVTPADAKKVEALIRERDEARADAERWRQKRIKDREIADGDVGCHLSEVGRAHARIAEIEAAVLRGISALAHLPPDEGPIRRVAKQAIDEMRAVLSVNQTSAQPTTAAKDHISDEPCHECGQFAVVGSRCFFCEANGAAPPSTPAREATKCGYHDYLRRKHKP